MTIQELIDKIEHIRELSTDIKFESEYYKTYKTSETGLEAIQQICDNILTEYKIEKNLERLKNE